MNLLRLWTPIDEVMLAGSAVNQLIDHRMGIPEPGAVACDDSYVVSFGNGDEAAALAAISQINRLLAQAQRVSSGGNEQAVYLQCRRAAGGTLYRSPILAGSFTELDGEGYYPDRGLLRAALRITRAPYWEAATESELALSADGVAAPQTGGVAIANRFVIGQPSDWVDVGGSSVDGELPAPVRLQFTPTYAGAEVWRIHAGFRSERQNSIPAHVWDSEAATGGEQQPAAGAEPAYHGGFFRRCTWQDQAPARLLHWVLGGAQQQRLDGRWHTLIARLAAAPGYSDLFLQARISVDLDLTLWAGPWARVGQSELVELGCGQIPPQLRGLVSFHDLHFELWAKRYTDGAHVLDLDHVMAICAEGYRRYHACGNGLSAGQRLIDDGLEDRIYAETAGGALAHWQVTGPRPMLLPQCNNRFTFLWQGENAAQADYTANVRLWYRPRVTRP